MMDDTQNVCAGDLLLLSIFLLICLNDDAGNDNDDGPCCDLLVLFRKY